MHNPRFQVAGSVYYMRLYGHTLSHVPFCQHPSRRTIFGRPDFDFSFRAGNLFPRTARRLNDVTLSALNHLRGFGRVFGRPL